MKISIIITIYNAEKYLKATIDSVINQTMSDFEIILTDNGSTDGSRVIAEEYANKYKNIRIIYVQDNIGTGAGQNIGLRAANGEYIYFLDSDDIINKNLLERCYNKMSENLLDIVFFGFRISYPPNTNDLNEDFSTDFPENEIYTGKGFLEKFLNEEINERMNLVQWRMMYKKDFLIKNKICFLEGLGHEDVHFAINVLIKAKRIMNIKEVFYIWQKRINSTSCNINLNYIKNLKEILNKLFKIIQKEEDRNMVLNIGLKRYLNSFFKAEIYYMIESKLKNIKIKDIIGFLDWYIESFIYTFEGEVIDEEYCLFAERIDYILNMTKNISKLEFLNSLNLNTKNIYLLGEECLDKIRRKVLNEINLMNNKKIGIYGIGSHTESILQYYTKNIGEINAEIIFIDSFKGYNDETKYNRKIINVTEINNYYLDYIIISSASFENKLYLNLKKHLTKDIKIYRLYEKIDFLLFY